MSRLDVLTAHCSEVSGHCQWQLGCACPLLHNHESAIPIYKLTFVPGITNLKHERSQALPIFKLTSGAKRQYVSSMPYYYSLWCYFSNLRSTSGLSTPKGCIRLCALERTAWDKYFLWFLLYCVHHAMSDFSRSSDNFLGSYAIAPKYVRMKM